MPVQFRRIQQLLDGPGSFAGNPFALLYVNSLANQLSFTPSPQSGLEYLRSNTNNDGFEWASLASLTTYPFAGHYDWVNPLEGLGPYHVSGIRTTTTTTTELTSGNNVVSLSDASSFKDGQGISIQGAGTDGPNNNELITSVQSRSGNQLTLSDNATATASVGSMVRHDDTAEFNLAISENRQIQYSAATETYDVEGFNLTSPLLFSSLSGTLKGPDDVGIFYEWPATETLVAPFYLRTITGNGVEVARGTKNVSIGFAKFVQDPDYTPTAGAAIQIGDNGSATGSTFVSRFTAVGVFTYGTYRGIVESQCYTTRILHSTCAAHLDAGFLKNSSPGSSSGDPGGSMYVDFSGIHCIGPGIELGHCSKDVWSVVKLFKNDQNGNSGELFINPTSPAVGTLTMEGAAIDNVQPGSTGITIGGGNYQRIGKIQAEINCRDADAGVRVLSGAENFELDVRAVNFQTNGAKAFDIQGSGIGITGGCQRTSGSGQVAIDVASTASDVQISKFRAFGGFGTGLNIDSAAGPVISKGANYRTCTTPISDPGGNLASGDNIV